MNSEQAPKQKTINYSASNGPATNRLAASNPNVSIPTTNNLSSSRPTTRNPAASRTTTNRPTANKPADSNPDSHTPRRPHGPHILLAIDSFKGCATSAQVEAWLAEGIRRSMPDAHIEALPIADGGEGTAAAIQAACNGTWHSCTVHGPLGNLVAARYVLVESTPTEACSKLPKNARWQAHSAATNATNQHSAVDNSVYNNPTNDSPAPNSSAALRAFRGCHTSDTAAPKSTSNNDSSPNPASYAVIEMAEAAGIQYSSCTHADALAATTYGVGEVVLDAISHGARRLYLGIGGSATNDGGAGFLQALGAQLLDAHGHPIGPGLAGLAELATINLMPAVHALAGVEIIVLCDVTNPLLGPRGTLATFGPQKGLRLDKASGKSEYAGPNSKNEHTRSGGASGALQFGSVPEPDDTPESSRAPEADNVPKPNSARASGTLEQYEQWMRAYAEKLSAACCACAHDEPPVSSITATMRTTTPTEVAKTASALATTTAFMTAPAPAPAPTPASGTSTATPTTAPTLAEAPGAGAAGGLGAALLALGAQLAPGIQTVLDLIGFDEAAHQADFIITGEGNMDAQTAAGKAPVGVAQRAHAASPQVVVAAVCGGCDRDLDDVYAHGIDFVLPIAQRPMPLSQALLPQEARANLMAAGETLARIMQLM